MTYLGIGIFLFMWAIICSPSGKTRYVHHGNLRIRYFGTEDDGKRILEQMKVEDAKLGR